MPASSAFWTASASAWVSFPSVTAASSFSFCDASRSAVRSARASSTAAATLASSRFSSFATAAISWVLLSSRSAARCSSLRSEGLAVDD